MREWIKARVLNWAYRDTDWVWTRDGWVHRPRDIRGWRGG
jgi:hypothetical protein